MSLVPLPTKLFNINLALDLTWLWFQVKAHKDIAHFETAYVVKMHNVARLAPTQPVSKFSWSIVFFRSGFDVCLVGGWSSMFCLIFLCNQVTIVLIFCCSWDWVPSVAFCVVSTRFLHLLIQKAQLRKVTSGIKSCSLWYLMTPGQPWYMVCGTLLLLVA